MTAERHQAGPTSPGLVGAGAVGALVYLVGLVTIGFGGPALLAGTDLAVGGAAIGAGRTR